MKDCSIVPMNGHIVVKLIVESENIAGRIIIPQKTDTNRKVRLGTVVARGPDVIEQFGFNNTDGNSIVAGSTVLYSSGVGIEVLVDKHAYYIVKDEDIIAIMGNKNEV